MLGGMKRKDINQTAFSIVQQATGESEIKKKIKNPVAVARGKKRMDGLSEAQKQELGTKAREARTIKEALASQKTSASSLSVKQN
jgi:hypothetical protein